MIKEIIQPETDLEKIIIAEPEFIDGASWGEPRTGHPEGQVIFHIAHVLENVDKYSSAENREKLRLIAMLHDTFKYKVDAGKSKTRENNHAVFARQFATKYITDSEVLNIIELHDFAYYSWLKGSRDGNWVLAEERAKFLIAKLGDSIDLYLLFYQCDNETGDKKSEDFNWFKNIVDGR